MKALIVPAVIAILAGIGGGSGYSYMRAAKKYVADSTQLADSLKAHPADSTTHDGNGHDADSTQADSAEVVDAMAHEPMTPADSMRAVEAARASLHEETKGLTDAKPVTRPTPKPSKTPSGGAPPHAPPNAPPKTADTHAPAAHDPPTAPPTTAPKVVATSTQVAADAVNSAKRDAMDTTLPEARLAKIFAAMKAKEAAKVLEQMNDADVRTILGIMTDKQAAAILASLPAPRAAAVTKSRTPGAPPR